jgi:hypothetical protein
MPSSNAGATDRSENNFLNEVGESCEERVQALFDRSAEDLTDQPDPTLVFSSPRGLNDRL